MDEKNKDSKFLDVIYQNAEEQKAKIKQDIRKNKKKTILTATEQQDAQQSRESKFFDAINQDAEAHIAQISREIEAYRNERIEQATEQGLNDAYALIHEDVSKRTASIVNEAARKELVLRNELYKERQAIRDKVFRKAEEQLRGFTQSADYAAFLSRSAQQISDTIGADKCVVYLSPADLRFNELIARLIPEAQITEDKQILIGGLKAYCPAKGILLDDTLDTRLKDQYAWFNENAGLKVV